VQDITNREASCRCNNHITHSDWRDSTRLQLERWPGGLQNSFRDPSIYSPVARSENTAFQLGLVVDRSSRVRDMYARLKAAGVCHEA
jgi:hypothetical protein